MRYRGETFCADRLMWRQDAWGRVHSRLGRAITNLCLEFADVLESMQRPVCTWEKESVADALFLSLWYPSFELDEMLPRALAVMRQFPFSAQQPGISYVAMHPVSWNEPTIFEQRFNPGVAPAEAALLAADLLHEDYAYSFEAFWDLWIFAEDRRQWFLQPSRVNFLVHGVDFDEGAISRRATSKWTSASTRLFFRTKCNSPTRPRREFGLTCKSSWISPPKRRKAPAQADVFCGLSPKKTWRRN